jgi:hypothetical protein
MTSTTLLSFLLLASSATAQEFGPDTCVQGFVWREAFSGDHVCVEPAVRAQAAADNQAAASRRQSGGGPYGPDTCRSGFVWRDARADDHVCVPPATRTQAANDNSAAASRYVRSQASPARGRLGTAAAGALVRRPGLERVVVAGTTVRRGPTAQVPAVRPEGSAKGRGFDDQGSPYVEEILPDGTKRREQRSGVTIIRPDGTTQFTPFMTTRSNAQPPTPPQLPDSGLVWVNYHNKQLLDLISALVKGDTRQMDLFHAGENRSAGADPFKQIGYRMQVLDDLAKP